MNTTFTNTEIGWTMLLILLALLAIFMLLSYRDVLKK